MVTEANGTPLVSLQAPIAGYTPQQLRDAYKITEGGNPSTIIAAVAAYGYDNAEGDLNFYRNYFGLPACTKQNHCFKKLNQDGKPRDYPEQGEGSYPRSADHTT